MRLKSDEATKRRSDESGGWRIGLSMAGVALMVGGCMVGPNYRRPEVSTPAQWRIATTRPTTIPSVTVQAPAELAKWWTSFEDPILDSLVAQAMQSNLDLQLATARIRQARALRRIAESGLWPTASVGGSYKRAHGGGAGISSGGGAQDFFQVGLDASWELDVFGGVRRDIEAATADLQATVESRRDVLVTLISEVALNYLDLRGFQQQLVIAKKNLTSQVQSAELTRKRFEGGFASGLDVANAEAQVATTRSLIPSLESQAEQAINELDLLLGMDKGQLVDVLSKAAEIPVTPPVVPVGLPSDLLRRRPDIRLAEAQLHAATARIGVATAELFPKFSFNGSIGTAGNTFSSLGNWDNRFWSFGPGVSYPIFTAGRLKANVEAQNAVQEQTLIQYEGAVITAIRDVQNALVAYGREQERRVALTEAVVQNRRAVELATQLYTQGQTDFLNVLNAQRSLLAVEDALVGSNRTIATNLVALYKALGGGWEFEAATTRPVEKK